MVLHYWDDIGCHNTQQKLRFIAGCYSKLAVHSKDNLLFPQCLLKSHLADLHVQYIAIINYLQKKDVKNTQC